MPGKVLTTAQAEADARKMLSIINQVSEQFKQLNATGRTLSDPNHWDGGSAAKFRADWPQVTNSLNKMASDLQQLHGSVTKILKDIEQSGGGL